MQLSLILIDGSLTAQSRGSRRVVGDGTKAFGVVRSGENLFELGRQSYHGFATTLLHVNFAGVDADGLEGFLELH